MKTLIPALMLATALASIQPADACHRFHTWRYPWPQRCGVSHPFGPPYGTMVIAPPPRIEDRSQEAEVDHSWYVEVTKEPPVERAVHSWFDPGQSAETYRQDTESWFSSTRPPPAPLEDDARTPDQVRDFDEHYIELDRHRVEINNKMTILHAEEDAARAAGIGQ